MIGSFGALNLRLGKARITAWEVLSENATFREIISLKWFQWFTFGERFLRAILESDSPTHTNAGRRQSAAKTPKKQLVSSQWAFAGCLELINCNYHLIYYARIRSHTFKGLPLGKVLSRLIIPFGADRIAVWLWFHCDVTAILLRSHFRLTAGSMRPHSGEMILVSELQSGNRTPVDVFSLNSSCWISTETTFRFQISTWNFHGIGLLHSGTDCATSIGWLSRLVIGVIHRVYSIPGKAFCF